MSSPCLDRSALLIVDVQRGLTEPACGERINPEATANIERLLDAWRRQGLATVHVRHNSVEPGSALRPELPGNAWQPGIEPLPGETEFTKSVNSAFVGTSLERHLRDNGIERLVVVGLTTDHCVSATTRSASDLGFDVVLVSDASAAVGRRGFDGEFYSGDLIHRVSLVSLDGEFCSLRTTAQLLGDIDGRRGESP